MYSGQSLWQTFKMPRHRISGDTSFLPLLSGFGWHGETQWVQVHGRVLGFVYYTAYADRSASAYALSRNRKVPLRKSQKHSGYRCTGGCWLLYITQPTPIAVPVHIPFPVTAR